ncbi:MAG: hypothetical protein QMD99_16660, partial [Rhizobiaceae bacterium]|nr:hypothetical protein [Rhizobiaceae bacterium]
MTYKPFAVTAATFSLVTGQHDGGVILANRAAGITFTLPDATGSGAKFEIVVQTTITSNSLIVQAPDASNIMTGTAILGQDVADTAVLFETAADTDTITM